jgi:hypothetical protein
MPLIEGTLGLALTTTLVRHSTGPGGSGHPTYLAVARRGRSKGWREVVLLEQQSD